MMPSPGADPAAALVAAIDKANEIRFNSLEIARQAQHFSHQLFTSRLRAHLHELLSSPAESPKNQASST